MNGKVTNFAYPAETLGDASPSFNPFAPKLLKSLRGRGCEPRIPGSPGAPLRSVGVGAEVGVSPGSASPGDGTGPVRGPVRCGDAAEPPGAKAREARV